jgi:hypothetical protein
MKSILIDARNFDQIAPQVIAEQQAAPYRGFDLETFDDAHEALRKFRESKRKVIFDVNRTTLAGFSLYAPGAPNSWYVNLQHYDAENRVPFSKAKALIECARSPLIIHNVPFERTMLRKSLGFELGETICTLQMAVSNHGPDEFDPNRLGEVVKWDFRKLIGQVLQEFRGYDPEIKRDLNSRQTDLLRKVIGKESDSAWSWNGFVDTICYGYGLKQLVQSFFGRQMTTFEQVMATPTAVQRAADAGMKCDMRFLTGEEVVDYGGDDAYEAVQIFIELLRRMKPEALQAFLDTENPMTSIYADIWAEGICINGEAVKEKFIEEEENRKRVNEQLRQIVQAALPFPEAPNAELFKREDWYAKNWQNHRHQLEVWRGAGKKEINVTHFMKTRVLLYDLFGLPIVFDQGKVASDGEARGRMLEAATGGARDALLALKELAGVSQRIKLFLTPYQSLTDPTTSKMYPVVSSKLATRRMAASFPNPMQLAKHADGSQYIRGFYLADS